MSNYKKPDEVKATCPCCETKLSIQLEIVASEYENTPQWRRYPGYIQSSDGHITIQTVEEYDFPQTGFPTPPFTPEDKILKEGEESLKNNDIKNGNN
jgi:hypothetical protein